jgi:drug/metabolite transporter (DMT)-like permease
MTVTQAHAPAGLGWRVWTALGIVYVVWGSTYLAIRFVVETMPPLVSGGVRFLTAGVIMLIVVIVLRGWAALRATRTQLAVAAISGVLLLLGGNGLVTIGEQRVPSGITALIVGCVPLWIVVLRTVLRDRPAPITAIGVLLGLGGVALLFLPGGDGSGFHAGYGALIVLAALSWAIGSLLVARLPVPTDPLTLSTVEMLAGGAAMLAVGAGRGELAGFSVEQVSGRSWLALAYLVVFGSLVAFTAYVWLLGHARVSVVATYAYVNPAVAVVLGALLASEQLTAATLVGGLVILLAVALVVTAEGRQQRRAQRAEADDATEPEPVAA